MTQIKRTLQLFMSYRPISTYEMITKIGTGAPMRRYDLEHKRGFAFDKQSKPNSKQAWWLLITPPELVDFEQCRVIGQLALAM